MNGDAAHSGGEPHRRRHRATRDRPARPIRRLLPDGTDVARILPASIVSFLAGIVVGLLLANVLYVP